MSRYRLLPSPAQEAVLAKHCAHARFVWNLAVEQHARWHPGRRSAPGYLEQCRQLTAARAEHPWLAAGSQKIKPAFTSQRCSVCGHMDAESRKSQACFVCTACGFACNADVDAAINIAAGHPTNLPFPLHAREGLRDAGPMNREPQLLLQST